MIADSMEGNPLNDGMKLTTYQDTDQTTAGDTGTKSPLDFTKKRIGLKTRHRGRHSIDLLTGMIRIGAQLGG